MTLQEIAAALKQKYRPVFRGGFEAEARAARRMAQEVRDDAERLDGMARATAAFTGGKGE